MGEERQPLVAGRRVQRTEDLVESGLHDRGQPPGRDICCEHRLQRPHAALTHGRVGVLEAGAIGEVDEAPNTRGVVAQHVLDLLERHPLLRDRPVRAELDHRRCMLLAEGVSADGPPDRGLRVAAMQGLDNPPPCYRGRGGPRCSGRRLAARPPHCRRSGVQTPASAGAGRARRPAATSRRSPLGSRSSGRRGSCPAARGR